MPCHCIHVKLKDTVNGNNLSNGKKSAESDVK